jgi:hypothetical protein
MDIQEIIEKYEHGDFDDAEDEKYAGGFWDLAGELSDISPEQRQDEIYNALKEVYERVRFPQ